MINDWLAIPYKAFGRDQSGADCWGLVTIARKTIRGDDLPLYPDISPIDKPEITRAAGQMIANGWRKSDPIPGSVATVWRFGLLLHIGIVLMNDGMLGVMDTTSTSGVKWQRLTDFERHHQKVIYYDYD